MCDDVDYTAEMRRLGEDVGRDTVIKMLIGLTLKGDANEVDAWRRSLIALIDSLPIDGTAKAAAIDTIADLLNRE